jgi:hypothetical protein
MLPFVCSPMISDKEISDTASMNGKICAAFERKARLSGFSAHSMREVTGVAIAVWRAGTETLPDENVVPKFPELRFHSTEILLTLPIIKMHSGQTPEVAERDQDAPGFIADHLLQRVSHSFLANAISAFYIHGAGRNVRKQDISGKLQCIPSFQLFTFSFEHLHPIPRPRR